MKLMILTFFLIVILIIHTTPTTVALGQLITRQQLSIWGRSLKEHPKDPRGSFRFFFRMVCGYWVFRVVMFWFMDYLDPSATSLSFVFRRQYEIKRMEPPGIFFLICAFSDFIWYLHFGCLVYILRNIR